MKLQFRKMTAWLLTFVMLFTMLPGLTFTAFAADMEPVAVASVTTSGGVTTDYADLSDALTAAQGSNGSTLKLLADIP